ncbi:hypothetical protein ANAPC5_01202 [Anaplasma phagocytophilum]|nr:hypothetical protein ANAPC5_01202 [Anaplasma phagocytophilum]
MDYCGLDQLSPIKNSAGNVLDLVLSNISVDSVTPVIHSLVRIDEFHRPFEVIFCLPRKKPISRSHCTYNYAQGDYLSMYRYFECFDCSWIHAITDTETVTEKFSWIVKDAIDTFVPQRIFKPSIYSEWFSKNLKTCVK